MLENQPQNSCWFFFEKNFAGLIICVDLQSLSERPFPLEIPNERYVL
jgi:hypothetical protein